MHPAKRFFYVSLGILALVAAFHWEAYSVRAQTCQLDVAEVAPDGTACGVVGRTFYYTTTEGTSLARPALIPGTARVVAIQQGGGSGQQPMVILEDGEVLRWPGEGEWVHAGSLCSASEPTAPTTWGRIKAERR